MITVRYPNGFSVQYNAATQAETQLNGNVHLQRVDDKGKKFLQAIVLPGSGAIIEWTTPCRMYSALEPANAEQFDAFMRVLRDFPRSKLKQLKKELTNFDAKSYTGWKS